MFPCETAQARGGVYLTDGGVFITRDLLAICIYQHLVYYRPKARFEAILYIFTKVLKRHNVCFFLISDSTEKENNWTLCVWTPDSGAQPLLISNRCQICSAVRHL